MMAGGRRSEAAEWSITPTYSASMDFDTNRLLAAESHSTASATVTADLRFARAMESSLLSIEPTYSLRRFTDQRLGNGDDRGIGTNWSQQGERSTWQANASYTDESTLTTELLESGIVNIDTHRRQPQAGLSWDWSQTELLHMVAQSTYQETNYYGLVRYLLPGYKYYSGLFGERFTLSEVASVTVSAFGDDLSSRGSPPSHEYGLQAELVYAFGERTRFDGTVGESSRLLYGNRSLGTNASLSLTRDMTRGNLALNYVRSLTPYGIGYLVQRQQTTVQGTYHVSEYLDANFSVIRIDNSKNAVLLGLDRRNVTSITTSLSWRPWQTVSLGFQVSMIQAPVFQVAGLAGTNGETVRDWKTAVRLSWSPLPLSVSR